MRNRYVFLLVAAMCSVYAIEATPPIGCEQAGAFLHCWNQGAIAPDTYYNVSSGFWQHANSPARAADVTYTYGYGGVVGGVPVVRGMDIVPNVLKNASDNNTYYWADAEYSEVQGGNTFTLHKNHTQNLTSDYVNVRFSFMATRRITGNNWFFHGLKGADVARDGMADLVTFAFENGSVETFDASLLTNFSRNITKLVIDGGPGTYSYVLDFGKNVTLWYTTGVVDGDFLLGEYIGTVEANIAYTYSYLWVDAVCTMTCSPGAAVTVTDAQDFSQIWQGETKDRRCKYAITRFLPANNCTFTADCNIESQHNLTPSAWTAITSTSTGGLRCENATSCTRPMANMRENVYYTFNLSGYLQEPEPDFKYTSHRCAINTNPAQSSLSQEVVTNKTQLNVTIWTPPNGTQINNTVNWSVFGCNWSGPAPSFTRLLFNDTINYTQAFTSNLSINRTFDFYACLGWTCEACKFGHCHKAWNGNYTFCQVMLGGPPCSGSGGLLKSNLILSDDYLDKWRYFSWMKN